MGFSALASTVQDVERVLSNEGALSRAAVGMIDVMSKTVFCVCIKDSVLYTWKQTFEQ
jgi:hypothetical protein